MIQSIELQVISKILTSEDDYVVEELLKFDASYYSIFKPQIEFIINHREKYGKVPDRFTFQVEFPDVDLVSVDEPLEYLTQEMRLNKKAIILRETFSKIKDLGLDDVAEAWKYIGMRWEESEALNETDPMNIITDSEERAHQIQEYSKQARIPTGFPEIDEVLYGGLSTVEELCIVFARTNTGKAQPLWSKVLTPSGWKTMRDIKVGDTVVGKNNDNGKVVQIFPQGVKDYYMVHFDDGTYAECCDDHLWEVVELSQRNCNSPNYEVLRLEDIRNSGTTYTVDLCGAIHLNPQYDAQRSEFLDEVYTCGGYDTSVYDSDKVIDMTRSSGLFVTKDEAGLVTIHTSKTYKTITSIQYAGRTECQCIMVDNYSHTYITDDYTVTHNTWVLSKMMESAQRHGFPSLYYSPEMQPCYLATRFDSWRGGFHNSDIIRGIYDEKYQKYLKELPMTGAPAYVLEDSDSPSGVVDVPLLTHYVRKYKIKMLIIDGLSYMEDVHSTTATAEHIKFKNLAHDLFRLSKRYGCCVLVAMQANRDTRNNAEKNGDAKEPMPGLHNIESSDQPGRICTTAIALRQIWAAQTMDMKIQKSRNSKRPDSIYTYNWDPNTGTASLKCVESASGGEDQEDSVTTKDGKPKAQGGASNYQVSAPGSFTSISSSGFGGYTPTIQDDDHDVRDDEDVEF